VMMLVQMFIAYEGHLNTQKDDDNIDSIYFPSLVD